MKHVLQAIGILLIAHASYMIGRESGIHAHWEQVRAELPVCKEWVTQ